MLDLAGVVYRKYCGQVSNGQSLIPLGSDYLILLIGILVLIPSAKMQLQIITVSASLYLFVKVAGQLY